MNELLHFCANYWYIILLIVIAVILIVFAIKKKANIGAWMTERASGIRKLWGTSKAGISSLMKKLFCDGDKILYGRIGVAVVMSVMLLIVLVSFFHGGPKFEISNGVIYVLGLILLVIFSDSIKSLKIGNLVELQKKVDDNEKQVSKLTNETDRLQTQLNQVFATIHNSNNNNNSNSPVINNYNYGMKGAEVAQAEEIDATPDDEDQAQAAVAVKKSTPLRKAFNSRVDQLLMQKYVKSCHSPDKKLFTKAKFKQYTNEKNSIMTNRAIFVGYAQLSNNEEFFFDCPRMPMSTNTYYRIYYMASMVVEYAQQNNKKAKLVLLLPEYSQHCDLLNPLYQDAVIPEEAKRKLEETFAPAINANFIEVTVYSLNKDEFEQAANEARKTQNPPPVSK